MRLLPFRCLIIGLIGVATAAMVHSPRGRPDLGQILEHMPDLLGENPGAGAPADKPALAPTRDVVVTWRVQQLLPTSRLSEMTEYYSVAQSKKRDEFPGGMYWITDLANDRVSIVMPQLRAYASSSGMLRISTMLPKQTAFSRGPGETIAGIACTNWHIAAPDGYEADVCMTDDGVPLRLADRFRRNVATNVAYGPVDANLFAVPAEFQRRDLPPLGPTRDATVSYRGEHIAGERLREDVFAPKTTVYVAATTRMARFEANGSDYLLADDGTQRVTHVSPADKAYRVESLTPNRPALLYLYAWPLRMMGKTKFSRGEAATIAGTSCTTWHAHYSGDSPWFDACISDDGLVLRLTGALDRGGSAMEATSVTYGPSSASLFTVPPDFTESK